MAKIEEMSLPGVGVRLEFVTAEGNRVGVVHHRTGRRELFICSPDDPDTVTTRVDLTDEDSHALAEALGASTVVESLTDLQQQVEGLAIDWLTLEPGSPFVGHPLGEARIRTRTGVSVVAVIRDKSHYPAPGPDFTFRDDDTLVVVGTPEGIEAVIGILKAG
ncbi:MAG: cation:proton antiporter regulatory subunit [Actinobacteria bacterium]|nr:cation:proton antiporter regulatory subunit [Actinomycetota bacterium]